MILTNRTVKDLSEYLAWVKDIERNLELYNRQAGWQYKFHLYFRGVANTNYTDCPSIYRDRGLLENEHIIFNECIASLPNEFINENTTFDKLVKLQHYGLPTRLLDITKNPLTALYFATRPSKETLPTHDSITKEIEGMDFDSLKHFIIKIFTPPQESTGAVIAYYVSEQSIKYSDSDTISAISNIVKQPYERWNSNFTKHYMEYVEKPKEKKYALTGKTEKISNEAYYTLSFNDSENIAYLLHDIRSEKPHYSPIIRREHLESIWCVVPKINNKRIARQDGAFLLIRNKNTCNFIG